MGGSENLDLYKSMRERTYDLSRRGTKSNSFRKLTWRWQSSFSRRSWLARDAKSELQSGGLPNVMQLNIREGSITVSDLVDASRKIQWEAHIP